MPVSKQDLLKVQVSRKRVERFKEAMLQPAKNPVNKDGERKQIRLRGLVFSPGQDKPAEEIKVNPVLSAVGPMRSSADKLSRQFKRRGMDLHDYLSAPDLPEVQPIGSARRDAKLYVPATEGPKVAKPNARSPFKRERKAFLVEKKGL